MPASYAEYVAHDADLWEETVNGTSSRLEQIKRTGTRKKRLEFVNSVQRAALELFVASEDEDQIAAHRPAVKDAAHKATKLAMMLMTGAPPAVIEHEMASLQGLVQRAKAVL